MNEKALKTLEFDKIISLLADKASSVPGRIRCLKLLPMKDMDKINNALEASGDAYTRLVKKGSITFGGLTGIEDTLKRLAVKASLNMAELLTLASLSESCDRARDYGLPSDRDPYTDSLTGLFSILKPMTPFAKEVRRCILAEDEMADDASAELRSIRRSLAAMNDRIHEALDKIVNGTGRTYLQDPVVTMRNGRYCLPVKLEYKNQISGMVHDQSGSGSTVFIEPTAVVKLNNECRELELKEQLEIERILQRLSERAGLLQREIRLNFETMSELDFIFAKGKLALDLKASKPIFNDRGFLRIRNGRHPLLDPEKVVPIDIELGGDFSLLVVTGPNTGGKTVSLKTVGLLTLMGEAGLLIPASDRSELSIFSDVYADIGDEQSIEQSLSTFSAHMTNIVSILGEVKEDSLVLFDELGAGTDPTEGAALAISILESLHKRKIRTMATTHYSELKVFALQTEGVRNASCEFNVETLRPTYRILIGIPGKSNAFAISRRLGLPDSIIDEAKLHIKEQDEAFEDLLTDLELKRASMEEEAVRIKKEREEAENLRREAELLRKKLNETRDKILTDAKEEAELILMDAKEYADENMKNFRKFGKNGINSAQMEREREALRKKIKSSRESRNEQVKETTHKQHKPTDFQLGDSVRVHSMNCKGIVSSKPDSKGNILVQMGILKSRVHYSDLEILPDVDITGPDNFRKTGGSKIKVSKARSISPEISLRGMTVDEALAVLSKYLDDACLANLSPVRIVHGKGTGALRNAVHNYLRKAKHVKSFRLGEFGEGDAGVTIVELK
ncbi:MAG: endonuclease MutS2 [Clostridiales bacterium]|nr:endonuclease MutS2 [Clostridiales bacterium]